ncbi:MAG TPA: VOC family protein [Caulobacteraceae bacterium]|jgi:predicted lactoylglutathione lyase|nr:VOC family protein [Caulobacteraceae bacterium]
MDLGYFEFSLPVKDIAASMAFYEAVGFERVEYASEAATATMLLGDCRLGLFQGHLQPDRPQLIFWQGPVEAVAGAASEAGLRTLTPLRQDAEGGASVMLEDPDGHPLYFIRMKTFYPHHPAHTQAAPAERPAPRPFDPVAGWFEASLPVADIARTQAFYAALGFEVVVRETKGTRVTVQNADSRIGLFQGHLDPDRPQLIFWQGRIGAMAQRARSAGLAFHREPQGDDEHGAFMLLDPDANPLFFIHMPGLPGPAG